MPAKKLRRRLENRTLRKLLPPSAAAAVVAAGEALDGAGLAADASSVRLGIYLGSTSFELEPEFFAEAIALSRDGRELSPSRMARAGRRAIDPLLILKSLPNAALSGIAIEYSLHGPALNLANGPASGLQAVIAACGALRRGDVVVAVAGGADSAVAARRNRASAAPVGEQPAVGEGAAIVVLERFDHAESRRAGALAEVASWAETSGQAAAVAELFTACLDRSGVEQADAAFGDLEDDRSRAEVEAALRRGPAGGGERGEAPVLRSTTAALGLTGAASGAFSLCHAIEALSGPPTDRARSALVFAGDHDKRAAILLRRPRSTVAGDDP